MKRTKTIALTLIAVALGIGALDRVAVAAPKTVAYAVRAGDSCWSIALNVFGKGERYDVIHRYNRLGPLPHILKPGQVIYLPAEGAQADAAVDWLRRDVKAKSPHAVDWRRAQKDMSLWKLYKVSTGNRSFAGIVFEDRSQLRMRDNALLVIYGRRGASAKMKRLIKTDILVERGIVRGGLASLDQKADLLVKTPASDIALRSTMSQVEVDKTKTSIVSVYQGKAAVRAQGVKVEVPDGHGTFVARGKKPAAPRKLPPKPAWAKKQNDAAIITTKGRRVSFETQWTAVKVARRYRVELSRKKGFRRPMVDAVVGAGITRFRLVDLAPGTYFARVAAIDRHRLEGRPSKPLRLRVIEASTSRALRRHTDGIDEVVGLLKISFDQKQAHAVEIAIDGGDFRPAKAPVRLQKPGLYEIKSRSRGGKTVATYRVRVLALRATLAPSVSTVKAGQRATFKVRLRDERDRPAVAPGLSLSDGHGERVPLTSSAAGEFIGQVQIDPNARTEDRRFDVAWAGGRLASTTLRVVGKPTAVLPRPRLRALPAPMEWPLTPVALEWGRQGLGLPSRTLATRTHLGLSTFFAEAKAQQDVADAFFLRTAVRAELALLSGRVGLDADLPLFNLDLNNDPAHGNELGDLRLGARAALYRRKGLTLGPSLRVTIPTGGFERAYRSTLIETGALLRLQLLGEKLALDAGQLVVVEAAGKANASALYYSSFYSAAWRFLPRLSVVGEFAVVIGLAGPSDRKAQALTASASLRVHLRRVRLGISGGAGLNDDARRLLGGYAFGLTADLSL